MIKNQPRRFWRRALAVAMNNLGTLATLALCAFAVAMFAAVLALVIHPLVFILSALFIWLPTVAFHVLARELMEDYRFEVDRDERAMVASVAKR